MIFVEPKRMEHQQWDQIVLRNPDGVKSAGARFAPKARQNTKPQLSEEAAKAAKLANETDVPKLKTITPEMRRKIVTGRTAKKMTRDQLANAINVKPSVVRDYEEGKAVIDNKVVTKMERALGTRIR